MGIYLHRVPPCPGVGFGFGVAPLICQSIFIMPSTTAVMSTPSHSEEDSDGSSSSSDGTEPPIGKHKSLFIFDWDDTLFPTTAFLGAMTGHAGVEREAELL